MDWLRLDRSFWPECGTCYCCFITGLLLAGRPGHPGICASIIPAPQLKQTQTEI